MPSPSDIPQHRHTSGSANPDGDHAGQQRPSSSARRRSRRRRANRPSAAPTPRSDQSRQSAGQGNNRAGSSHQQPSRGTSPERASSDSSQGGNRGSVGHGSSNRESANREGAATDSSNRKPHHAGSGNRSRRRNNPRGRGGENTQNRARGNRSSSGGVGGNKKENPRRNHSGHSATDQPFRSHTIDHRPPRQPLPSKEEAPLAAIAIRTTGIHPTTAHLLAISVALLDDQGRAVTCWHRTLNTGADPGPLHLYGLDPQEFTHAPTFASILRQFARVLDGRVAIVHDTAYTWGFITHEARRALRSNSHRGRTKGKRRPPGRIPRPSIILDTQATARRQEVPITDARLRGIAASYDLVTTALPSATALTDEEAAHSTYPGIGAQASMKRALLAPDQLLSADAHLLAELALVQLREAEITPGELIEHTSLPDKAWEDIDLRYPSDLQADRFGLQRSTERINATNAAPFAPNPGVWIPGRPLEPGMIVCVAPEISANPDAVISAAMQAGLTFSEKLVRDASLIVFNGTGHGDTFDPTPRQGKAMHAHRKDIPLISDREFITLAQDLIDSHRSPSPSA